VTGDDVMHASNRRLGLSILLAVAITLALFTAIIPLSDNWVEIGIKLNGFRIEVNPAVLSDGSVYVAGYNANGNILVGRIGSNYPFWIKRVTILETNRYGLYGVATGADGSVYVLGEFSNPSSGTWPEMVFKLDKNGNVVWFKSYDYYNDIYPTYIATSADGSIYVLGYYRDEIWPTVVYKLNEAGDLLWFRIINIDSQPLGITVAPDGSVYVGGYCYSCGSPYIAKLDPYGNLIWIKTLNNLRWVLSIAASTDGGVYVGMQDSNWNYVVGKLNGGGNLLWLKAMGGLSLAVTSDGGVYSLQGSTLFKLDKDGNLLQAWTIPAPSNYYSLYVGASGNCVVVVSSPNKYYGYIAYGYLNEVDTSQFDQTDRSSDVSVNDISSSVDSRFDPTTSVVVANLNEPVTDVTTEIAVSSLHGAGLFCSCNSFTATTPTTTTPTTPLFTLTPVSQGVIGVYIPSIYQAVYKKFFTFTSHVIGSDGAIYLAGFKTEYKSGPFSGLYDNFVVAKYDYSGNPIWFKMFSNSIRDSNLKYYPDIAVAPDGSLYVATYNFVAKLDQNGNIEFYRTFGGYNYQVSGIDVAPDGSLYITGEVNANHYDDAFVAKINPAGKLIWFITVGGVNGDYGYDIVATPDGGAYLIGETFSFGPGCCAYGRYYLFVARIDRDGNLLWFKTYSGVKSGNVLPIAPLRATIAPDGGIYVTGYVESFSTDEYSNDIVIMKIDQNGNLVWLKTIKSEPGNGDIGRDVAVDSNGNVYVAGEYKSYSIGIVAVLDPNGNLLSVMEEPFGPLSVKFYGCYMTVVGRSGMVSWGYTNTINVGGFEDHTNDVRVDSFQPIVEDIINSVTYNDGTSTVSLVDVTSDIANLLTPINGEGSFDACVLGAGSPITTTTTTTPATTTTETTSTVTTTTTSAGGGGGSTSTTTTSGGSSGTGTTTTTSTTSSGEATSTTTTGEGSATSTPTTTSSSGGGGVRTTSTPGGAGGASNLGGEASPMLPGLIVALPVAIYLLLASRRAKK